MASEQDPPKGGESGPAHAPEGPAGEGSAGEGSAGEGSADEGSSADETEAVTKPSGEEQPGFAWSDEDESPDYGSGGSMQFQDPEITKPRPPTPAELRAREKYEKKQQELEEARLAAEAKAHHRKRVLMGTAATVGVVGLVAGLGYWAFSAPTVTAQCVRDDPNGQPVIVADNYCTDHSSGGLNGFFFYGGHQYRYYYGSSGGVGSRPIGGSTSLPSGATVKTKSGSTIQRGGLGGKFGGRGGGS